MIKKKICLLGAFGVGKTSLVRQFLYSEFDERYHSTIGAKVDRVEVCVGERRMMLMVWDIAGEEKFFQIQASYYAGASGCLFVADGTREDTLEALEIIRERVLAQLGRDLPHVILLNKSDLAGEWQISERARAAFEAEGVSCLLTSARTGVGVEAGFSKLAAQMLEKQNT